MLSEFDLGFLQQRSNPYLRTRPFVNRYCKSHATGFDVLGYAHSLAREGRVQQVTLLGKREAGKTPALQWVDGLLAVSFGKAGAVQCIRSIKAIAGATSATKKRQRWLLEGVQADSLVKLELCLEDNSKREIKFRVKGCEPCSN